jgi:hypothetical protein
MYKFNTVMVNYKIGLGMSFQKIKHINKSFKGSVSAYDDLI